MVARRAAVVMTALAIIVGANCAAVAAASSPGAKTAPALDSSSRAHATVPGCKAIDVVLRSSTSAPGAPTQGDQSNYVQQRFRNVGANVCFCGTQTGPSRKNKRSSDPGSNHELGPCDVMGVEARAGRLNRPWSLVAGPGSWQTSKFMPLNHLSGDSSGDSPVEIMAQDLFTDDLALGLHHFGEPLDQYRPQLTGSRPDTLIAMIDPTLTTFRTAPMMEGLASMAAASSSASSARVTAFRSVMVLVCSLHKSLAVLRGRRTSALRTWHFRTLLASGRVRRADRQRFQRSGGRGGQRALLGPARPSSASRSKR